MDSTTPFLERVFGPKGRIGSWHLLVLLCRHSGFTDFPLASTDHVSLCGRGWLLFVAQLPLLVAPTKRLISSGPIVGFESSGLDGSGVLVWKP